MKKKIRTGAIAGTIIMLAVGGSVAYFVVTETAHNVISTSGVGIRLYEITDETDLGGSPVPFSNIENAMPGVSYSKIPIVENDAKEPVWVRASLEISVTLKSGEEVILPVGQTLVTADFGDNWLNGGDGYYYYLSTLSPAETTEPLFEQVSFSGEIVNSYQNAIFSLTINADAAQVANNGSSAITANWTEGEE